jgi:hypothetical protein
MKYTVYIDDNFHSYDESERCIHGEYDTADDAIMECKNMVDDFLETKHKRGMTAEELYRHYTAFGEDPFITSEGEKVEFSAWQYAKQRCSELSGDRTDEVSLQYLPKECGPLYDSVRVRNHRSFGNFRWNVVLNRGEFDARSIVVPFVPSSTIL